MKFLPIILRNLLRNRRRTILTVISIAVSVFLFATLITLPSVVDQITRQQVSDLRLLSTNKAGYLYLLPEAYGNTIALLPHVDASSGYIATLARYRAPGDVIPIMGLVPTELRTLRPEWGIGAEAASALAEIREAGLVSGKLAARFRWKVGDIVVLHPTMLVFGDLPIRIVGILGDEVPMELVIVPLERLDQLGVFKNRVIAYMVKADRAENASLVAQEIDQRFANSPFETNTQTEVGAAEFKLEQFRLLFVGVKAIAAIIVIVIAMVAANTAAMTVRERRQELAVMLSMGFTPRALAILMTAEGLLIGLIAGSLGCLIAYALLRIPAHIGGPMGVLLQFVHLTPPVAIESIAIAAGIGLLSVGIPALQAARRNIVDMLRAVA